MSNLNLFGERIDGYGLVENYVVDYATKNPINITNVTIKEGTKIVKSGFIGGYASGQNQVYITNCKIEKGVTIGCDKDQDNIGGFAGEFNGIVINCVNEGDVFCKNFRAVLSQIKDSAWVTVLYVIVHSAEKLLRRVITLAAFPSRIWRN